MKRDRCSMIWRERRTPGGLWLPQCYADLAKAFDLRGRHDDAIGALEVAIEHGWGGRPHPRSDIAEFHLRAGRHEEAARIWAELKAEGPDDVWLYNAAGLSYSEVGDHELAVAWLAEGIELAIRTEDPEGIVPQLSEVRRGSLSALGSELDDLEQRADEFVAPVARSAPRSALVVRAGARRRSVAGGARSGGTSLATVAPV